MKIIDAQVHIWSQTVIPPGGGHRQVPSLSAEELLVEMAEVGVDAGLIHPPASWDPTSNALAIEAAKKYPDRFAIMGQFPPENPDNVRLIPGWRNQPGMMGLRWALLYGEQPKMIVDGRLDWIWPAAEKEGLPVSLQAGVFLRKFRWIAETHPALKLIIDHCGLKVLTRDVDAIEHLDELLAIAKLPNVAVKATGAPAYSTQPYPYKNLHEPLHRIYDAFGPDRFFWGTDITRMPCTWRQCVTFFTEELPWLRDHDQELEKVMGRGLAKWIGWDFGF
ncbi:amidohydrolase family protein [Reyranella sp.]|uniref:amidohydrolase family protein n=1 Tax=Reyranella sp. TaxID=1929291 RepID=UPI003782ED10